MEAALLRDVFQWDVRTWSRALPFWEKALEGLNGGTALAVGERDGGLALWLALKGFEVHCTDLSAPSEEARRLHERYGVLDRITYRTEDITSLSVPDNKYDVVVFKSVIGALGGREKQATAVRELHRALKPGGVLLFAENLEATRLHKALRRRFAAWSRYWRYLQWPADAVLFALFTKVGTSTTGCVAAFGRTEEQRSALARIDAVLCRITPASWHYVLMGVCTKAG